MQSQKEKINKKYTYSYPEQRKMFEGLITGDVKIIAEKTGYSLGHLYDMIGGRKKIQDSVIVWIDKLTEINKQKKEL